MNVTQITFSPTGGTDSVVETITKAQSMPPWYLLYRWRSKKHVPQGKTMSYISKTY